MQPLSAHDILQIWELGQRQHPVDRALTLLHAVHQDRTWEDLAAFSIGQRDAVLFLVREQLFGTVLNSFSACPHCHEPLEFAVSVTDLRVSPAETLADAEQEMVAEAFTVRVRLPNSWDLAAIAQSDDVGAARDLLVRRCVLRATQDGNIIAPETLPTEIVAQLAQQITKCDPQAEVLLNLFCPACHHQWQAPFDIEAFLWTELDAYAKRLVREVHTLARAYGWREADILSMNAARRNMYLTMVS